MIGLRREGGREKKGGRALKRKETQLFLAFFLAARY